MDNSYAFYAYATEITRAKWEGRAPDMAKVNHNKKPYRTKAQKVVAREKARKCSDGAIRSTAPASYHNSPRGAA